MGADVDALVEAVRRGDAAKALALLKSVDPSSRDGLGNTPLHWAAWGGRVDNVRALLKAGADPNARDGSGLTQLRGAAAKGRAEAVER
ncbi:MAG: ankyrin repeat domain-containing protein [Acidilobus sp.]